MHITNLNVRYGSKIIYDNFSISFQDQAITFILGPSGCGKTTLLNSIAKKNNIEKVSYIFQEPRLLPWYNLEKNITLVLQGSVKEKKERALYYLEKVGLGKRAGDYPAVLSGGERQRVSIARSFSFPAPILLMDEPFQSQDPNIKFQLIDLVKKIQVEEKRTIIAVSHDVQEATAFADRAIIINGRPVTVILDIPITDKSEHRILEVLKCQNFIY